MICALILENHGRFVQADIDETSEEVLAIDCDLFHMLRLKLDDQLVMSIRQDLWFLGRLILLNMNDILLELLDKLVGFKLNEGILCRHNDTTIDVS